MSFPTVFQDYCSSGFSAFYTQVCKRIFPRFLKYTSFFLPLSILYQLQVLLLGFLLPPKLTVSDSAGRVVLLSRLGFTTCDKSPLAPLPLRGQLTLDLSVQHKAFTYFEVFSKL